MTYHGWDKKYDEWIDIASYRLAPQPAFPPAETLFTQAAAAQLDEAVGDEGTADGADAATTSTGDARPTTRSSRVDSRVAEADDALLRRWAEGIQDLQRPPPRPGVAVNY